MVLLVEDDNDDADLFAYAVRRVKLDWSVQRVWNGQTAVDYFNGQGDYANRETYPLPNVVVMDARMPRRDGLELLDWRRTSSFLAIPFFVWTGRPDLISRCLELGADGAYLKEPNLDALIACLERLSRTMRDGRPDLPSF